MAVKRIYNERWTEEEETNLINARIRLDDEFLSPKTKNHFQMCWKRVIREANLDKPMPLVTNKWQNILKKYKKIIREQSSIDEGFYSTNWGSFHDLHRFLKNKSQIKFGSMTSAEESATDASISLGDMSFDYDGIERNLITQQNNEPKDIVTYDNKIDTHNAIDDMDPNLAIVKNEINIEPTLNEQKDNVNQWNNLQRNYESANEGNIYPHFSTKTTDRTAPNLNDVSDFDDSIPEYSQNYMPRPVNRIISGKRKMFRKPEYISPKVLVKEPTVLTRFRSPRLLEEDEDRSFLISLIPSLKKLNDEQKLIVKTEFLKVLTRVTFPNSSLAQNI